MRSTWTHSSPFDLLAADGLRYAKQRSTGHLSREDEPMRKLISVLLYDHWPAIVGVIVILAMWVV